MCHPDHHDVIQEQVMWCSPIGAIKSGGGQVQTTNGGKRGGERGLPSLHSPSENAKASEETKPKARGGGGDKPRAGFLTEDMSSAERPLWQTEASDCKAAKQMEPCNPKVAMDQTLMTCGKTIALPVCQVTKP